MAEDRMIRASMRESEKVNSWPIQLRFFWTQLWGYCDSYGRGRRDARLVVAGTFPMDEEVDVKTVERWMKALEQAGVIESYEVAGKHYFECPHWDEHQEIRYRKKTDIPDKSGRIPTTSKSSETLRKSAHQGEGEVEGEIEIEGEVAPSPYCLKHPNDTDEPCGPCGRARKKRELWDAAHPVKAKGTPQPPKSAQDPATCNHKFVAGWCVRCEQAQAVA